VLVVKELIRETNSWMVKRGLSLGIAPDKTAALLHDALVDFGEQLCIEDRDVPFVEVYKYLGLLVHYKGATASSKAHQALLLSRIRSAVGRLRWSGIRAVRPMIGVLAYLTRVRPLLTYGLATWGLLEPSVLKDLEVEDYVVQRMVLNGDWKMARPVLNATTCIPTLECELDRSVLRLLLRLIQLPADNMFRGTLQGLVRQWCSASTNQRRDLAHTWWAKARARLQHLDDIQRQRLPDCPYVDTRVRFVRDIERLLLCEWVDQLEQQPDSDAVDRDSGSDSNDCDTITIERATALLKRMNAVLGYVTDWAAWSNNQNVINGMSSLHDTRDLLSLRSWDGRLPFLRLDRCAYITYLTHLRGGTYYLLGYQFVDATCPWCRNSAVSVPHLLRDCLHWRGHRQEVVSKARRLGIQLGVMSADTPDQYDADKTTATLWYHLMVGHPVPLQFLDLEGLFPGVAPDAAERTGPRPPAVPGALSKYEQILRHLAPFVVEVLHRTQLVFGVERPSLRGLKVDAQWINPPAPAGRDEERLRDERRAARKNREAALAVPPAQGGPGARPPQGSTRAGP
jgi:hypothetical protein